MESPILPKLQTLLGLVLATAFLGAGCGDSEKIPARAAAAMAADLAAVDRRVEAGECKDARAGLETLELRVRELPQDVDSEVRGVLEEGVGRLGKLVEKQCTQKPEPPTEDPSTQPPAVTAPEPTPTVTEPQRPQEPQVEAPQVEEPTEPEEPQPPEEPADTSTKKPKQAKEPKKKAPTQAEKDICGDNPSPAC